MPRFGSTADFMQIPTQNLVAPKQATAPANPVSGQFWADTSTNPAKLKWYDGTKWVTADASGIADGQITDQQISPTAAISLSKLAVDPLSRANHNGTQLAATISDFTSAVRSNRLDQMAAPTASLDANAQRIINVGTPTGVGDAANKAYVDNARAGFAGVKQPVKVAVVSANLGATPGTLDGITMVPGDRFLLATATANVQAGIYLHGGTGQPSVRAADADQVGEVVDGTIVAVAEGTYAGYQFIQQATATADFATWAQLWTIFSTGGTVYAAGNGLTLTGNTFALGTPVSISRGGTGASNTPAARSALGVAGAYAANLPALTAGVAVTVTHNLSSSDARASFYVTADKKPIELDTVIVDANSIQVTSDIAFAAAALRVMVFTV